ncbi:leucyl aminopeptidase [Bacillus solitudinis]|uniref:leucyl aminopeptidase n=1 Tax=Bacillus solitudinis TaxID=2014074 RepID=UPI000C24383D|nr:leucyl aminopeptidase [Bacillus solitudinis]
MFEIKTRFNQHTHHEVLVVGISEKGVDSETFLKIDEIFNGELSELRKKNRKLTKRGELTKIYTLGRLSTKVLYFVGLGEKQLSVEESNELRELFAIVGKQVKQDRVSRMAIVFESFCREKDFEATLAFILGESIALSSYKVFDYKEKSNEVEMFLSDITMYTSTDCKNDAEKGFVSGISTNYARDLVNRPGNLLTPSDLADEASILARNHEFEIDIIEKAEMEQIGMGALLAVAAGSDQAPKMIVLKYQGKEEWTNVLGLVGKGLTFDSGGISIKSRENLHQMKMDMGGAAAVLGAMNVIGTLKPTVNVLAVIPASENLLNGSALKPGDVIRSMNGKTIEVRNTDAEGRLILADGMTYAKQLGANYLIDVATLTGAVSVALGDCTTGAVTNNQELMSKVMKASLETGEWVWEFPTYKPYHEMLRTSDVADLNNAPGRLAGSITAGLFIGEFAEGTPWVHLDIAGTAWQTKENNLGPIGGTGVMVRTIANLAIKFEGI